MKLIGILFHLGALIASAQPGPVRGPVLGYIFNQQLGRLQPIRGIPGSAFRASPLDLGTAASLVEVSPRHDFALVVAAQSGELLLARLSGENPLVSSIPGATPDVDRIVISPSGKSAALYSRRSHEVQILTGLPDAPSIAAWQLDFLTEPETVTAMALSDDASVLLLAATRGDVGSLIALGPQTAPRQVYPLNHVSSVAFVGRSRDALVAASENDQVLLIHDVTGAANTEVIADSRNGVSQPVAVAASRDERRAFAANAGSGTLLTIPLTPGQTAVAECHCRPSRLQRLVGQDVFLLSEPSGLPLFILDADSSDPRIVVVPSGDGVADARRERRR